MKLNPLFAILIFAFFTLPTWVLPAEPLATTVTADPTPIRGTPSTVFHVGILVDGVVKRYTIMFYVTADPTPTPTPKPTPTPTPTTTP